MGINTKQLLHYVIRPALTELASVRPSIHSRAAELLLLGTAAKESAMGTYLRQLGSGPARGVYQAEPPTIHDDINRIQGGHPDLWEVAKPYLQPRGWPKSAMTAGLPDLTTDLVAATMHARLHYWLIPERLPPEHDIYGMGQYWYKHWCRGCAGTIAEFVSAWDKHEVSKA